MVLDDEQGFVLAVVPAAAPVDLRGLARALGHGPLRLADAPRLCALFPDCDRGAVPAVGMAWGTATVGDDSLGDNPEPYLEAGDHDRVIRLSRRQFMALMRDARPARCCEPAAH